MTIQISTDIPETIKETCIKYAKVASATGDTQAYEVFNILREKIDEALYGEMLERMDVEEEARQAEQETSADN